MKKPDIYWSVLPDKSVGEYAFMACLALASRAGNMGYSYMVSNCQRTDVARNKLCAAFRKYAAHPDDILIMLDCDHTHPHDIIERLANHDSKRGVVGALAFRRGEPYFPCFFLRAEDGTIRQPLQFTGGLMKCTIVGTGAIAIRRWVLDEIAEAGYGAPFLYEYNETMFETGDFQSEDVSFGYICEKLGIAHWCDTGLITGHLTTSVIDDNTWAMKAQQLIAHHEAIETVPLELVK